MCLNIENGRVHIATSPSIIDLPPIFSTWIFTPFSEAKMEKNHRKIVLRNMRFSDTNFLHFFLRFLAILLGFWEAPGPQKIEKKSEKIDFPTRSVLKEGSGAVLGGF